MVLSRAISGKTVNFGLIYKILFLVLGFMSFNGLTANTDFLTVCSYCITVLGACLFVYRALHYKKYVKTKGLMILSLFLLSYVISALLTVEYGVIESIKAAVWLFLRFFLLYTYDSEKSPEQIKKECVILGWTVIILTFTVAAASIGTFFFAYGGSYKVNGTANIVGLALHRLWGLYTDPNYGAVLAAVSVIVSSFYVYYFKNKALRAFLSLNIVLEAMYIAFSQSRTGQVSMMAAAALILCILVPRASFTKKLHIVFKTALIILLAAAAVIGCVVVTEGIVFAGNGYLSAVGREDLLIGRGSDALGSDGKDISNRRFDIWGSGLEIFLSSPVFGVSFAHIVPYAQEKLPQTYVVNNDLGLFSCMHNMFIDVLASQGAVGAALMLSFMLIVLIFVLKRLFKLKKDDYVICVALIGAIVPVFVSCFLYSEIVYINTAGSVIFWVALGYLMSYIGRCKNET